MSTLQGLAGDIQRRLDDARDRGGFVALTHRQAAEVVHALETARELLICADSDLSWMRYRPKEAWDLHNIEQTFGKIRRFYTAELNPPRCAYCGGDGTTCNAECRP